MAFMPQCTTVNLRQCLQFDFWLLGKTNFFTNITNSRNIAIECDGLLQFASPRSLPSSLKLRRTGSASAWTTFSQEPESFSRVFVIMKMIKSENNLPLFSSNRNCCRSNFYQFPFFFWRNQSLYQIKPRCLIYLKIGGVTAPLFCWFVQNYFV